MKQTSPSSDSSQDDEMQAKYQFDYTKARPNRFAPPIPEGSRVVVLDTDIAKVFTLRLAQILSGSPQMSPQRVQTKKRSMKRYASCSRSPTPQYGRRRNAHRAIRRQNLASGMRLMTAVHVVCRNEALPVITACARWRTRSR